MNSTWLFKDLLQHEVRESLLVNLTQLKIHLLHLGLEALVPDGFEDHLILPDHGKVIIVQVDDPLGMFYYRRGIGGNEILSITHSYHQRRSLSGSEELARLVAAVNSDAVGAFNLVKREYYSLFCGEITLKIKVFHKVCKHLRVSLAGEPHITALKMLFNACIVLNDAVVHHYEVPAV